MVTANLIQNAHYVRYNFFTTLHVDNIFLFLKCMLSQFRFLSRTSILILVMKLLGGSWVGPWFSYTLVLVKNLSSSLGHEPRLQLLT